MSDSIPIATPDGYFVSQEHKRIAEIINDYNPDLYLLFMPHSRREPGDKPYAVMHQPANRDPYIVAFFDEVDERILEFIFLHDASKHDILARQEAKEAAEQVVKAKQRMDEQEERADIAKSLWRSPLHQYNLNGKKLNL